MKAHFPPKSWWDKVKIFLHEQFGLKLEWITDYDVVGSTIIFNKRDKDAD
jgi:hypothetical protein